MSSPICLTARLGSHVHICALCFWKKDCKNTHLQEELWTTAFDWVAVWRLVMSHRWISHLAAVGWTSSIYTVVTNMLSVFLIPFGSKFIQFTRSLSTSHHKRLAFMFLGCFLETFSYCVKGVGVWPWLNQQNVFTKKQYVFTKSSHCPAFCLEINSIGDF